MFQIQSDVSRQKGPKPKPCLETLLVILVNSRLAFRQMSCRANSPANCTARCALDFFEPVR